MTTDTKKLFVELTFLWFVAVGMCFCFFYISERSYFPSEGQSIVLQNDNFTSKIPKGEICVRIIKNEFNFTVPSTSIIKYDNAYTRLDSYEIIFMHDRYIDKIKSDLRRK
jgi:hypothetical protein